jgi:hypothetical protein
MPLNPVYERGVHQSGVEHCDSDENLVMKLNIFLSDKKEWPIS